MLQELIETLQKAQQYIKEYKQIKVELKAVIEERDRLKLRLIRMQEQKEDFFDQVNDSDTAFESIDLGLDTLHYRLEHGNLLIRQRLESFLRSANTIPNKEVV